MIKQKEKLFKIVKYPFFSEKTSNLIKKNIFVLNVIINSNKLQIKKAVEYLFLIKVKKIRTLIVKGKKKKNKNRIYYKKNWKKVYITFLKDKKKNLISLLNKKIGKY